MTLILVRHDHIDRTFTNQCMSGRECASIKPVTTITIFTVEQLYRILTVRCI